jgi:hypothetical protein
LEAKEKEIQSHLVIAEREAVVAAKEQGLLDPKI